MQKAAAAMVLRWGIIGCGDVTEVKSGPAFQSAENSKLVAVMRRDAQKAKDYAERHQVPKWYNTLEGILTDPEVGSMWGLLGLSKVGGMSKETLKTKPEFDGWRSHVDCSSCSVDIYGLVFPSGYDGSKYIPHLKVYARSTHKIDKNNLSVSFLTHSHGCFSMFFPLVFPHIWPIIIVFIHGQNSSCSSFEVDAIYVATPPGSHLEVALEVAKHGKPCYLEKPMARTRGRNICIYPCIEFGRLGCACIIFKCFNECYHFGSSKLEPK